MSNTVEKRSIYTVICEYIRDQIEQRCVVNELDPEYRASEVIVGRLQGDPVSKRIHIEVNIADPGNTENSPSWIDKPAEKDAEYWGIATYEIGGGQRWVRRFTVDVKCFFNQSDEDRTKAQTVGTWVFMNAQRAIMDNAYPSLVDDLGERTIMMLVVKSLPYESGGEGDWIWKGKFWINCWTEIP